MSRAVLIDTNLVVLLVVGSASQNYIATHKRTAGYGVSDFRRLVALVSQFSFISTLPHVLAEASNLIRNVAEPARSHIQAKFKQFVSNTTEHAVLSIQGCKRQEFMSLGLTDAAILHVCADSPPSCTLTLLTADADLANHASSLGFSFIDWQEYQAE